MRSLGVLLFAATVAVPQAFAQAPDDSTKKPAQATVQKVRNPLNDLLDEAQAAMDKNDYAAAVPLLEKFIVEKPDVAYVHFQLAYAYTALSRPADALPEYEKCVALDPKMAEAQVNLGILQLSRDPKSAIAPLQKAVELLPSQSRPRFLLGLAQERTGDLSAAATFFESAVRLDPKDANSQLELGRVYLKLHRPADAEPRFRAAAELDPKSPDALQGVALSLDEEKKPEAVEAYRAYLAVRPQDTAAHSRLVHLLMEQGQNDAAAAEMAKQTTGNSPTLDELKLRADLEVAQKDYSAAIATLTQPIALAPNDAQLHGGLGRTYLQTRDFPSAEKELKHALQLDRNNITYWKDLSSTYYLAGNYSATLAALDVIAKAETPNAGAWFIRALCYDKLGDVQAALDAYRKFLELDDNKNPDQVWQANQRIHVLEKTVAKKK